MNYRYDVRWNYETERWEIVDLANRNAPTGMSAVTHAEAMKMLRRRIK